MYNVDNPVSLVGYLSRDQYGDWPILYGPDFVYRAPFEVTGDQYVMGKTKYEVAGKARKQNFGAKPTEQEIQELQRQHPDWEVDKIGPHIFPRMYDNGNERNQEAVYRSFGGVEQGAMPTLGNNIQYFVSYQFWWMYGRYFMWNFAGKQNDLQGFGNMRDGNWASGISFIDKIFGIATPDQLPATAGKDNKANNKLFFLPLIFGVLGMFYQFSRNRRDFLINFLLFFFTGFAIVIYLNQSGYQPRERDYAYVGSFYAFAVWIGLGGLFLKDLIGKYLDKRMANIIAFGVSILAVPVLMASQEWDDHDRSQKVLARDLGKDYLESCEKDAILITFGDNDTYPLWYTQEVEKKRLDLRVMNYSLLGTDWYINQLRYKVNESAPADVLFTPEQIQGSKRDLVFTANYLNSYNIPVPLDQSKYYDLYTVLKDYTGSDDPKYMIPLDDDESANIFPTNKVSIPVDMDLVKKTIKFNPDDTIVGELKLDIKKRLIQKNDLAILALIAANKWKRPLYFTSTQELEDLGLDKYCRLEGLSYRLVPVEQSNVQRDIAYKNIMDKFAYGNAQKQGVYYDEENRRQINSIRSSHAFVSLSLSDVDKKDSARKILQKYDQMVNTNNVPYGMTSNRGNFHNRISMTFLLAAYKSGDLGLAKKVNLSVKKDLQEQMRFYRSLGEEGGMTDEQLYMQALTYLNNRAAALSRNQEVFAQDIYSSYQMLEQLNKWEIEFKAGGPSKVETPPQTLKNPDTSGKKPDTP